MENLREKANSYAEENVYNVLKEAFAKVYADGYRDGYKDRAEEIPVDLRDNNTEFVDLGLPSGTLWAKEYENDNNETIYLPYNKAEQFQLPTEELWKELIETCKWKGSYSSSGQSFYGIVCIGPNGNYISFNSEGFIKVVDQIEGKPNYGGGLVYFWIKDGEESFEKKAIFINGGKLLTPDIKITTVFSGYKLPIRLVRTK